MCPTFFFDSSIPTSFGLDKYDNGNVCNTLLRIVKQSSTQYYFNTVIFNKCTAKFEFFGFYVFVCIKVIVLSH